MTKILNRDSPVRDENGDFLLRANGARVQDVIVVSDPEWGIIRPLVVARLAQQGITRDSIDAGQIVGLDPDTGQVREFTPEETPPASALNFNRAVEAAALETLVGVAVLHVIEQHGAAARQTERDRVAKRRAEEDARVGEARVEAQRVFSERRDPPPAEPDPV